MAETLVDEPVVQDGGGATNWTASRLQHADHQASVIVAADCAGTSLSSNSEACPAQPRKRHRRDHYGVPGGGDGSSLPV